MLSDRTARRPSARLFDGVSARDHAVTVAVAAGRLVIVPDEPSAPPECPLEWPLSESYPTAAGRADRLTVTTRAAPEARLVIVDRELRAAVAPLLAARAAENPARHAAVRWAVGLGVVVLLIAAAAGFASRHAAGLLPPGWGGGLSDATLEQLAEVYPACEAPDGIAALDRLATRMADVLDGPRPQVLTVRWDLVNAFALPGGRIVLTSGLIDRAASPQALASVLAHEVGHVARRDPLARVLRDKLVDIALAAVFGVSLDVGTTGAVAGFLLDNSYTRDQEDGADVAAIRILNALDIDPGPGARFFDRLAEADDGLGAVTWLRSHPLSADRAERLRRGGTGGGPGMTAEEWRAVEALCP
ncbi:metalloendopeptidase [Thalassobaculum fulvum]|uniref:Metalloendopeptidase n=1 Tax=Thalassobaculum fulvum TaxID=1633335 RepID=A0A918XZ05_9PROT|nr:M48 family metallopeptidase [Thalassobaculum fulvum]GHD63834.1 metalloendopeptidase [Thalassobaculum fulvum]